MVHCAAAGQHGREHSSRVGRSRACHPARVSFCGHAYQHARRSTRICSPRSTRDATDQVPSALHHRHHRPGRLLPDRAAAREGLRGPRPGPARLHDQPRPDRPHRQPRPAPALRRPHRRRQPGQPDPRDRAARGLQPRRAEPRQGLLRDAGVHRLDRRHRRAAAARGDPGGRHRLPLLPGLDLGDVRRQPAAAGRGDRVPPALAVRRRQALRALGDRQLPRGLRPVRGLRDPLQPRVPAARRELRDPQDHPRRRRDRAGRRATRCTWATSTRSATGATRRSTSRACGGCSSTTSPDDYVLATGAGPHRARVLCRRRSRTPGSTGSSTSPTTSSTSGPPRSTR